MAMTKPYRIDHNGSQFTVTNNFGIEFAVYNTEEEARTGIQRCEQDDTMLQTARDLVTTAVQAFMDTYSIDRQAARSWIREAAD